MLNDITPVILTFNEEPNIQRTLKCLNWAKEIIVVDSFSKDRTLEILAQFPQVRLFQKHFDSHSSQWNYAISQTGIRTTWVLALDADYQVTEQICTELSLLSSEYQAYEANFQYAINGKIVKGALYPPVTILYQVVKGTYIQDGHTQRVCIDGNIGKLKSPLIHDDRKPFADWWKAQKKYALLETKALMNASWNETNWPDRIRQLHILAPLLVFLYSWIVKGGVMDGRAGVIYASQRFIAESLLSWQLFKCRVFKRR